MTDDTIPVYVVRVANPDVVVDEDTPPIFTVVHTDQKTADAHIYSMLMEAFQGHLPMLASGGQVSIILSRGKRVTDDEPFPVPTSASFVLHNPPEAEEPGRHAWEFRVARGTVIPLGQDG